MPAFLKERGLFGTRTGRNLGRDAERYAVRCVRDFRGEKIARRKRTRKKKNHESLFYFQYIFSPACSPPSSPFIPSFPRLFPVSSFSPPSCTHTPVSWTFDKYLHEFRATARKLEKEAKRGQTLKFFRAIPWSVSLAPLLPLHFPRFSLDTSVLFSSYAAFSILDRNN